MRIRGGVERVPGFDTTSGDWMVLRASVNPYSCAPFFVMAIVSTWLVSLGVLSVVAGRYVPGGTLVCGVLAVVCVITPFRIVASYYVAISDTHVVAGRRRSRPMAVTDRSQVAFVTVKQAAAGLVHYRLCAADGTTLLVVRKQMDAAEIARVLGVKFYSAPGNVPTVRF